MATAVELRQRVAGHLLAFDYTVFNVNPTTNSAGGKPWFNPDQIDAAIQDAAGKVLAIIAAAGHPRRRDLMTTQTIAASGDLLPSRVGPIGAVRIASKPAVLTSVDDVQRMRDDALGLTVTGYYGLDPERIYFVGTPCTVDVVQIAAPPDVTTVPSDFVEAVVCYATAALMAVDGGKTEGAGHYKGLADSYLGMVASNTPIPETPVYAP